MSSIDEQVIDFYYELFDHIFTQPFRPKIKERLRRDAVIRQVQEAAGAASQALARFFLSQQLSETQVAEILHGFTSLYDLVTLEDIANPHRTPEALVEELLKRHPCPTAVSEAELGAVYRVALHLTIQVLMLVGPVMTEWQRLTFSSTYEMPRRIVTQLNQITEGLKVFASAGQEAADQRYELAYRDHLLQRFYRVEAGTVQMTTNLNVDLRELFVMPRLNVRTSSLAEEQPDLNANNFLDLSAARATFGSNLKPIFRLPVVTEAERDRGVNALDQVRNAARNVVVGVPGSGKSTFFEWLQLSIANVDEELIAGGEQAVPLLLRVRELDPHDLPSGAKLIEKATASRDRAVLMPEGWIDRYMKAGRVLLMLDGLDETDPGIRDDYILPWLADLCEKYADCQFLVSSRPVGYPAGTLRKLGFAECDLRDFEDPDIAEYARHWCTAIRLARNDPEEEARREGAKEGEQIVAGFKGHPYIRNLARNPLMLSGICLVNYFERGELPKDRALLYKLCVEGLLHHWDQRRGIQSEYSLNEKLRVCREVAIAMQADDRAEYEEAKVLTIISGALRDKERAERLLAHIRYRTGLLIERRAGVFAFAHLTFQEYLAAAAVYEGNHRKIDTDQLVRECGDSRWKEVIALYCGLASAKAARVVIESLILQPDNDQFAEVLADSFLSSNFELSNDQKLRARVLKRIAIAPGNLQLANQRDDRWFTQLDRFTTEEACSAANQAIGETRGKGLELSESFWWLFSDLTKVNTRLLSERLKGWKSLSPAQAFEVVYLAHAAGPQKWLGQITVEPALYQSAGVSPYLTQADVALAALLRRRNVAKQPLRGVGTDKAFVQVFRVLVQQDNWNNHSILNTKLMLEKYHPGDTSTWPELISLSRNLAQRITVDEVRVQETKQDKKLFAVALRAWANRLERRLSEQQDSERNPAARRRKRRASNKQATKKSSKRRRKA